MRKKNSQQSYFISLHYLQSDKQDDRKEKKYIYMYIELMSDYSFQDFVLF